jgi:hypothetical protein
LPEALRPSLRALIGGVVAVAQDAYRRRLTAVSDDQHSLSSSSGSREHQPITVGDQWPEISEILYSELANHPELLDRVLLRLANTRPVKTTPVATVASQR